MNNTNVNDLVTLIMTVIVNIYIFDFLAHLSRRLEWAIVIAHRPSSVRPSVVVSRRPSGVNFYIFDFSSETAERNSAKLDRKQDLNALYQHTGYSAKRVRSGHCKSGW